LSLAYLYVQPLQTTAVLKNEIIFLEFLGGDLGWGKL